MNIESRLPDIEFNKEIWMKYWLDYCIKTNKIKMKTNKTTSKKVNRTQIVDLIKSTKGKFFTITWTTNTGNQRTINGNIKSTSVSKLGYINVYSMKDKGYRNVNSQNIKSVSFNNTTYTVR